MDFNMKVESGFWTRVGVGFQDWGLCRNGARGLVIELGSGLSFMTGVGVGVSRRRPRSGLEFGVGTWVGVGVRNGGKFTVSESGLGMEGSGFGTVVGVVIQDGGRGQVTGLASGFGTEIEVKFRGVRFREGGQCRGRVSWSGLGSSLAVRVGVGVWFWDGSRG
ncbi:hypothetical protein TIFTF001_027732 [Ficus carica]|uniref:Uncharacterized protein n=1 Tax=Ficus carica TaxID=3494 RepID=A0AA88DNZ3_FICCA|nr:hypothetical protein TIFTF001_027732 [Ficus carica]